MAAGSHLKLEVARDELVAKLGIVSRAVSSRGTVQVLSGVLLAADGGTITLAAGESKTVTLHCTFRPDKVVVDPDVKVLQLRRKQAIATL